jgi:hypothetical protein
VNAVLASATVAWQINEYRECLLLHNNEELECTVCERKFSTGSYADGAGCDHEGPILCYAKENNWRDCTLLSATQMHARMHIPVDPKEPNGRTKVSREGAEQAAHAKWSCCAKPYLEQECPRHRHTAPLLVHERLALKRGPKEKEPALVHEGIGEDDTSVWFCNFCSDFANVVGCQPNPKAANKEREKKPAAAK